MTTTTRSTECTAITAVLVLALELGSKTWKLAFALAHGRAPRTRTINAGDLGALSREIRTAKTKLQVPSDTPVRSCYEAGRDAFWVHRALTAQGIVNVVVDPSSIAVDRRQRRVKTDRVDARALVTQLMNAAAGDRRGWREVGVPSVEAEDDRQLPREWAAVAEMRKAVRCRISGLLATHGVHLALTAGFPVRLATVRLWNGDPLPPQLRARLERDWVALQQIEARRQTLRRARPRG